MSETVFLPGWGMHVGLWEPVARAFPQARLLPVTPADTDTPCQVADNLAATLQPDSTVIAWSFSGLLALLMAYRYPRKCGLLILCASAPTLKPGHEGAGIDSRQASDFQYRLSCSPHSLMKRFIRLCAWPDTRRDTWERLRQHCEQPAPGNNCHRRLMHTLKWLLTLDCREQAQHCRDHTYYIHGTRDAVVPPPPVNSCKQPPLFADHLFPIANAGHALMATHPRQLITTIRNIYDHHCNQPGSTSL